MKIHAIQTGSVAIKKRQRAGEGAGMMRLINTLRDPQWTEKLPIYAWLIEHDAGLTLVDTGESARTADPGYFPAWHPFPRFGVRMHVQPEDEIDEQMAKLGYTPDDVTQVIMTHLHTDHAGGLSHFPNATILVSSKEWQAAQGLSGKIKGYLTQHFPAWFKPTLINFEPTPNGIFTHRYQLTPEIEIVPTYGHTEGHVSVIVRDGDLHIFIAGDTSYTEGFMLQQSVDGVSMDVPTSQDTLARILTYVGQYPTVYLPSHDPESANRLASKQIVPLSVNQIA